MEKRSLSLHGHRTSIALESEFWAIIDRAVSDKEQSFASFIAALDDQRIAEKSRRNLASYLRVWALETVQNVSAPSAPFRAQ